MPGDKKPKTIGGGRKTEIKADVVSLLFCILFLFIQFFLKFLNKKQKKKDVLKFIHRNKDEQSPILDLSKNNVCYILLI